MIAFIHKWRKGKGRAFPYRASLSGPSCPAETQCLSFAATTFPTTFIPSLSWRIDRFKIETAPKMGKHGPKNGQKRCSAPVPRRTPRHPPPAHTCTCLQKRAFFECFPNVCPEPVLVKRSVLVPNGAKDAVIYPRRPQPRTPSAPPSPPARPPARRCT
eukprot:COSAG06_NODE_8822_length_2062_cov_1.069282_2_plen_158_part_00